MREGGVEEAAQGRRDGEIVVWEDRERKRARERETGERMQIF